MTDAEMRDRFRDFDVSRSRSFRAPAWLCVATIGPGRRVDLIGPLRFEEALRLQSKLDGAPRLVPDRAAAVPN